MIGDSHLVIAKIDKFPPIPVAKIHGNPNAHPNTMKNLEQKYGKQNITIVTVGEKYNVLDKQQLQQPSPQSKYPTDEVCIGANIYNTHCYHENVRYENCFVVISGVEISSLKCVFNKCIFNNCDFYSNDHDNPTFGDISHVFICCTFEGSSTFVSANGRKLYPML